MLSSLSVHLPFQESFQPNRLLLVCFVDFSIVHSLRTDFENTCSRSQRHGMTFLHPIRPIWDFHELISIMLFQDGSVGASVCQFQQYCHRPSSFGCYLFPILRLHLILGIRIKYYTDQKLAVRIPLFVFPVSFCFILVNLLLNYFSMSCNLPISILSILARASQHRLGICYYNHLRAFTSYLHFQCS